MACCLIVAVLLSSVAVAAEPSLWERINNQEWWAKHVHDTEWGMRWVDACEWGAGAAVVTGYVVYKLHRWVWVGKWFDMVKLK